ncbi:Rieske (2Fe-2S) protein [Paenibacillus spongiae]|uniref:Rieske (2Fe-2S) protein n=1 Tax=Paenibacillus spongiae TaxID=2909671 RepID=A0ABY5SFE4_9BACL|nr:Rieske (2Fe-2S) protein [Paenibacillus spongiae]UVI32707.1 Rieske (2Fe-2S) protein [Paenibacillus spongiae]
MSVHFVAEVEEIPEGHRKIVQVGKRSIGIFNIRGEYYALLNYCPHYGAELCKGIVSGTTMESKVYEYIYGKDQEIIRCPWHGWEFDIKTGCSLFDEKVRAKRYEVIVQEGRIGLVLGASSSEAKGEQ